MGGEKKLNPEVFLLGSIHLKWKGMLFEDYLACWIQWSWKRSRRESARGGGLGGVLSFGQISPCGASDTNISGREKGEGQRSRAGGSQRWDNFGCSVWGETNSFCAFSGRHQLLDGGGFYGRPRNVEIMCLRFYGVDIVGLKTFLLLILPLLITLVSVCEASANQSDSGSFIASCSLFPCCEARSTPFPFSKPGRR